MAMCALTSGSVSLRAKLKLLLEMKCQHYVLRRFYGLAVFHRFARTLIVVISVSDTARFLTAFHLNTIPMPPPDADTEHIATVTSPPDILNL